MRGIAKRWKIEVADSRLHPYTQRQCAFYASQFSLLLGGAYCQRNRLATAYFHGRPGTGVPEFDQTFEALCEHHYRIDRIQVSHREMHDVVLSSGIDRAKVHLIRIGVDPNLFEFQTLEKRRAARAVLRIPQHANVIGSFQKDGVGWGEGRQPKAIKGPDVFISTIDRLRGQIDNLFVLLSGPARGYVRERLTMLGVPFVHCFPEDPREMPRLYDALDVYLVTSRQEGGPKAVLESMAAGVPVVTTRVGQAGDLVRHEENGWVVDVEDVIGLSRCVAHVLGKQGSLGRVLSLARETAIANSYESQLPQWRQFFTGFVNV